MLPTRSRYLETACSSNFSRPPGPNRPPRYPREARRMKLVGSGTPAGHATATDDGHEARRRSSRTRRGATPRCGRQAVALQPADGGLERAPPGVTPTSTHRRTAADLGEGAATERRSIASTVSVNDGRDADHLGRAPLAALRGSMPRVRSLEPGHRVYLPRASWLPTPSPRAVSSGGAGAASRAAPHGPIAQLVRAGDS